MTFEAIEHLTENQIEDLYRLYQSEWWTRERQKSDIQQMLKHSDVIVAFCDPQSKRMVAFARILTDYVYRALVLDVIVEESHRGKGLGRILMNTIINHPALKSVERLDLFCLPEIVPFYKKWGFTEEIGNIRFMRRIRN